MKKMNEKITYSPPDLPSDADSRGLDWYCLWLSVERFKWNYVQNTLKIERKWGSLLWSEQWNQPYFPADFASDPKPRACGTYETSPPPWGPCTDELHIHLYKQWNYRRFSCHVGWIHHNCLLISHFVQIQQFGAEMGTQPALSKIQLIIITIK